jgi:hypothetical protein
MHFIQNLKLNQLRKLFTMFKWSFVQSLNNFVPWEGTGFEFTSLSWFQILEKYFLAGRPTGHGPKCFNLGNRSLVPFSPAKWPVSTSDRSLEAPVLVATGGAAPHGCADLIPWVGGQEQLPGYEFASFTPPLAHFGTWQGFFMNTLVLPFRFKITSCLVMSGAKMDQPP